MIKFLRNNALLLLLRKEAKGEACHLRPVSEAKDKTVLVGGSLGNLSLKDPACAALNPKRILLALSSWSGKPCELNRAGLSKICVISNLNII